MHNHVFEYVEFSLMSDFIQTVKQFVTRFKKSYINKVVIIIKVVVEVVVYCRILGRLGW